MKFQDLLPQERFTLQSGLRITDATKKLSTSVAPLNNTIRGGTNNISGYQYVGEVTGNGFKIYNSNVNRNSLLPVVTGTLAPNGQGTTVEVTVKLTTSVAIFFGFMLFGSSLECVFGLASKNYQLVTWSLPAALLLLGALMFFFKRESANAKKFLTETLESNR